MKKIPCILSCKGACTAVLMLLALMVDSGCRAGERTGSTAPEADAGAGLAIRRVELFSRDNPAAPWRPVQEKGGLIFNNDCTVRIICELTVPKDALIDQLRQSVVVKGRNEQLVLLDRRRPADVMRDHDAVKTVSTVLFPCFQAAPAWLKRGEPVVVTVIVYLGKREASASVNLTYDLAE